jgi:hypothetical protein
MMNKPLNPVDLISIRYFDEIMVLGPVPETLPY